MLVFITGVVGSGKTYYAVNLLYRHFSKSSREKDEKYSYCYTNIADLDFSKLDNRVKKLDFIDLKSRLASLYSLYSQGVSDSVLVEKAKELQVYKSLFIVDEAHNYFDKKDRILVWWLTYHRHLYQDIYLITQNLSLIDTKYKAIAEYTYKAVPASLRFLKNVFRYQVYSDYRMFKTFRVKTEKLKLDKNVISLYHSGDAVRAPMFLHRFIAIGLVVFIAVAAAFYLLLSLFFFKEEQKPLSHQVNSSFSENIKKEEPQEILQKRLKKSEYIDEDYVGYIVYIIRCEGDYCLVGDKYLHFLTLNTLFSLTNSKFLRARTIEYTDIYYITALVSPHFARMFHMKQNLNRRLRKNFILERLRNKSD